MIIKAFSLLMSAACVVALAQVPSQSSSSAVGDIVNRSRVARDEAAASVPAASTPTSARSIDIATEIANRTPRGSYDPMPERYTPGMERAAESARTVNIPQLGQHRAVEATKDALLDGPSVYIFISQSQSDRDIKEALQEASSSGATVFLRGILPGSTLDKGAFRVQKIAKAIVPIPDVRIDPRAFQQFAVELVPTVVVAKTTSTYVKVGGSISVDYAKRRLLDGAFGDLGSRGQTLDILEPDLIADFQSRIAAVDWEAKKAAAVKRMFHSMGIVSLPKAVESTSRLVDPTVELANDIAMPDGNVVALAGSRFNPLKAFGFTRTIVVFDATDAKQLAFAKKIADDALKVNRIAVLITTELDRDRGMESFRDVSIALRPHKLFLLAEDVRNRLDARCVPTVAVREGDFLRVREYAPEDLQ